MAQNVKVIINGFGSIGKGVLQTLLNRNGVELVGVVDMNPALVGKDAGEAIGREPLGVIITNDVGIYSTVKADVAIQAANTRTAANTFALSRPALENGMNVVVANTPTCNLWVAQTELAEEIDKVCKAHNVSYMGFGVSHIEERMILAMAEGIDNIKKITFTHFADVSAFSAESNALDLGVGISMNEFKERKASGSLVDRTEYKVNLEYMGKEFGWDFDTMDFSSIPQADENGYIYALTDQVVGTIGGKERMIMKWTYILDPDKRYFDSYEIDGVPAVNAQINFTPDRGIASTYAAIVNAIPNAIKSKPGYISTLDVPLSGMTLRHFGELVGK